MKTERFDLKLTKAEKLALKRLAEKAHLSMASYLVSLIVRETCCK